jgi:bifunctional non-homologous end joining protein LigD
MLATSVTTLPAGDDWAFEFKWDGIRGLLDVGEHGVRITSRQENDVSVAYPELTAAAADLGDILLDGEVVAIRDGRPSFELLQSRMHVRSANEARRLAAEHPVTFVAFDVLRRFGVDLTDRPFTERRATLERWAADHPGWTVSPLFDDGPATEAAAREHGLEGVVAKRTASRYRPGVRTHEWVKLRFVRTGDYAVVGWEASPDHPGVLSSLVLARADGDGWAYAGKVGSGLSGPLVRTLQPQLSARPDPVVDGVPRPLAGRAVTWCEPTVVVEVQFSEVTGDGRLRHPVFVRVRTDKTATEALGEP